MNDPNKDDEALEAAIKKAVDHFEAIGEEVTTRLNPQWKSRAGILKTIISLCSGSVLLTVTFSASFRAAVVGPLWKWLVIVSFGLLVTALLLAFLTLWVSTIVYELPASLFTVKVRIPHAARSAGSRQEFLEMFDEIRSDVFDPIERSDVRAKRLFKASCFCFCLAMVLLGVVGFRQLSL